jgi:hypothetical protein
MGRGLWWVPPAFLLAIAAVQQRAGAQAAELRKEDLLPAACYLQASEVVYYVRAIEAIHAVSVATLPTDCDAPGADLYQSDPERCARSLTDLRDRYARDIKRLGYRNLPRDFEIEVTSGCSGARFGHGDATLRQHDFDLELVQSDKATRGAIVRDYVVFFSATGAIFDPEKGFELSVVYGKWTGDALVLRDFSGRCVSVLKPRPKSTG